MFQSASQQRRFLLFWKHLCWEGEGSQQVKVFHMTPCAACRPRHASQLANEWRQRKSADHLLPSGVSFQPITMLTCKPGQNLCDGPEKEMVTSAPKWNSIFPFKSEESQYSKDYGRNVQRPEQTQHSQVDPVPLFALQLWNNRVLGAVRQRLSVRMGGHCRRQQSCSRTGGRDQRINTPSGVRHSATKQKGWKKERALLSAQQLLYIVLHCAHDNELAVFSPAKSHKSMWPMANRPLEQHIHPDAGRLIANESNGKCSAEIVSLSVE